MSDVQGSTCSGLLKGYAPLLSHCCTRSCGIVQKSFNLVGGPARAGKPDLHISTDTGRSSNAQTLKQRSAPIALPCALLPLPCPAPRSHCPALRLAAIALPCASLPLPCPAPRCHCPALRLAAIALPCASLPLPCPAPRSHCPRSVGSAAAPVRRASSARGSPGGPTRGCCPLTLTLLLTPRQSCRAPGWRAGPRDRQRARRRRKRGGEGDSPEGGRGGRGSGECHRQLE